MKAWVCHHRPDRTGRPEGLFLTRRRRGGEHIRWAAGPTVEGIGERPSLIPGTQLSTAVRISRAAGHRTAPAVRAGRARIRPSGQSPCEHPTPARYTFRLYGHLRHGHAISPPRGTGRQPSRSADPAASPRSCPLPSGPTGRRPSATGSMIRDLAVRRTSDVVREPAQPIGALLHWTSAQRVNPDERFVDSLLPKPPHVPPQLCLVLGLKNYFPLSDVRRGASSQPLPPCLLPPSSLALSWHRPRIAGRRQHSKRIEPTTVRRRHRRFHSLLTLGRRPVSGAVVNHGSSGSRPCTTSAAMVDNHAPVLFLGSGSVEGPKALSVASTSASA
ncbi:hypothetical protein SUDANB132_00363 [Streptomyces sp. enrichment culture]